MKTYTYVPAAKFKDKYKVSVGDKFANNEILDATLVKRIGGKDNNLFVKVKCLGCMNERYVQVRHLLTKSSSGCKKCRPDFEQTAGNKSHMWKGTGKISKVLYDRFKRNANIRNIPFEVTMEDIWLLFLKQNECCALTGIRLTIHNRRKDKNKIDASLDRIDSSKGYTIENLQWVHKDVNKMKNTFTDERFIEICNLVAKKWPLNHTL